MARLIFISPYLKGGRQKAALANRTHYIATREGVDKLNADLSVMEPTKKQTDFHCRQLNDIPSLAGGRDTRKQSLNHPPIGR